LRQAVAGRIVAVLEGAAIAVAGGGQARPKLSTDFNNGLNGRAQTFFICVLLEYQYFTKARGGSPDPPNVQNHDWFACTRIR
jgi:hypothetical protein